MLPGWNKHHTNTDDAEDIVASALRSHGLAAGSGCETAAQHVSQPSQVYILSSCPSTPVLSSTTHFSLQPASATSAQNHVSSSTSTTATASPIYQLPSSMTRYSLVISSSTPAVASTTMATPSATAPLSQTGAEVSSSRTGQATIVGAIVGSLLGAALVVFILVFLLCRRRRQKRNRGDESELTSQPPAIIHRISAPVLNSTTAVLATRPLNLGHDSNLQRRYSVSSWPSRLSTMLTPAGSSLHPRSPSPNSSRNGESGANNNLNVRSRKVSRLSSGPLCSHPVDVQDDLPPPKEVGRAQEQGHAELIEKSPSLVTIWPQPNPVPLPDALPDRLRAEQHRLHNRRMYEAFHERGRRTAAADRANMPGPVYPPPTVLAPPRAERRAPVARPETIGGPEYVVDDHLLSSSPGSSRPNSSE